MDYDDWGPILWTMAAVIAAAAIVVGVLIGWLVWGRG